MKNLNINDNENFFKSFEKLIAEDESDTAAAPEKIEKFRNQCGVRDKFVNTKVMQYFYEKKRHIYDMLTQYWG